MVDSVVLLRDYPVKMSDLVILARAHDILQIIKDGPLPHPRGGLCQNIYTVGRRLGYDHREREEIMDLLRELWRKWPEYSYNPLFPVPGTWFFFKMPAHYVYSVCSRPWSRFTKYGRARRRLLAWLLEDIDERLASRDH